MLSQGLRIDVAQPGIREITWIRLQSSRRAMAHHGLRLGIFDWLASTHCPYLSPERKHVQKIVSSSKFLSANIESNLALGVAASGLGRFRSRKRRLAAQTTPPRPYIAHRPLTVFMNPFVHHFLLPPFFCTRPFLPTHPVFSTAPSHASQRDPHRWPIASHPKK